MAQSGAHSRFLGIVEIVAGAIIDWYTGTGGNELIALGASTILETLLVPTPRSAGSQGIIRSSIANQQILYGQVCTSGVLQFANSWGSNGTNDGNTAFLVCTVAHSLTRTDSSGTAGMPIGGVEGFYLNDVYLPINTGTGAWNQGRGSSNDGDGTCGISKQTIQGNPAAWNPLSSNLWISWSDGSQTTVDDTLASHFTMPSDFVGYGIAYTTWTMFASSDGGTYSAAYPAGIETPGTIKAVINGQRVYDPRQDSTNGGSGTQRLSDTTTWAYSANPALCLADYLTRSKNDGGASYANDQIDWVCVANAANICDEEISVPEYGATWDSSTSAWSATDTISRYTFNAVLNTSETVDKNAQTILKSMAGWLVCTDGTLQMYAGAETSSSGTIDESFLAGEVSLTNQVERARMWNAVKFTYGAEPEADYNAGQGIALINETYETQDGGVRLITTDTIPGCNNQFACQILERIKLQQSRNKMQLKLKCNMKALQFVAGDVVDISLSELGLTASPFRIIQFSMGSDYSITLNLLQENPDTFSLPAIPDDVYQAFDVPSFASLYNLLPAPPNDPTGFTATAISTGNLLEWSPPAANTYSYIQIYRNGTLLAQTTGSSYLDADTVLGTNYTYYINALQTTNLGNQTSNDTPTQQVTSAQVPIGADKTSENTSADTSNVGGVPSNQVVVSAVGAQVNLIPDPLFKSPGIYWTRRDAGLVQNQNNLACLNQLEYYGNGSPSGSTVWASMPFNVNPGPYTLSANLAMSGASTGNIYLAVYDPTLETSYGNVNSTDPQNEWGRAEQTITIPSGVTSVRAVLSTNNATVANGGGAYFVQPQMEPGSVATAFKDNVGDMLAGTLGVDFNNAIHANRNLDYLPDGVSGNRNAVLAVDGNHRALIDLSQGGHLNRTANNITYLGGGTVDEYRPSQPGADVTADNTAADTSKVNGVASANVSLNASGTQVNLVPDSGLKSPNIYWPTQSGTLSITKNIDGVNNCIEYFGTGAPSGYNYLATIPFTVTPGTYTLSANCWGNGITAGMADVGIYNTALNLAYGSLSFDSNGRQSNVITIPAGVTQVCAVFDTNNCTVGSGDGCGAQQIQLERGSLMTAYKENIGDQNAGTIGIDLENSIHLNRTANNITYLSGGTVDSLKPRQYGADVTAGNAGVGQNIVTNPSFESNVVGTPQTTEVYANGSQLSDGWYIQGSTQPQSNAIGAFLWTSAAHSGGNGLTIRLNQNVSITSNNTLYAMRVCSGFVPCTNNDGDVLTWTGWCYPHLNNGLTVPAGITLQAAMGPIFWDTTKAYISDSPSMWGTYSGFEELSGVATVPSSCAYVSFECLLEVTNNSGSTWDTGNGYYDIFFDDTFISVNDVRVAGSGAKAYIDFTDTTSGGHVVSGSIAPTVTTADIFSLTLSTSSIEISWSAFTVYLPNNTTLSISSGSQTYSSLSTDTPYYFYPFINSSGSIEFAGGANTATSSTQAATQNLMNNIPLSQGGWEIYTDASGGGSGGGGYTPPPPVCFHPSTQILTQTGNKQADKLVVGDMLLTPTGEWTPITALGRSPCDTWYVIATETGVTVVTDEHPFRMADGSWRGASHLRVYDKLAHGLQVLDTHQITNHADRVSITIGEPHAFMLTAKGPEVHNISQYP